METKQFDQLLENLRATIQDAGDVDEKGQELLRELEQDIRSLLERTGQSNPEDSMRLRMKSAIEHFEVTHPTLTTLISEVSAILNNAGI